jgi:UDP-N-acetyl-2-amino-2-deoxyglucuronate dehydrogenase
MALRLGADVLCEKPVVVSPWNVDALAELEAETGHRVWTVLQLRVHDKLLALRERLAKAAPGHRHEVELTYVTARGPWYDISWKGDPQKSGGIPTNIGVHFFDLLLWLFGDVDELRVHLDEPRRTAGYLALERADVSWFLSVEPRDLPFVVAPGARTTHRSIRVDGEEIDFSEGFTSLHTRVYEETLAGRGFGLADAKGSIALAHRIRNADARPLDDRAHPLLRGATRPELVNSHDQRYGPRPGPSFLVAPRSRS